MVSRGNAELGLSLEGHLLTSVLSISLPVSPDVLSILPGSGNTRSRSLPAVSSDVIYNLIRSGEPVAHDVSKMGQAQERALSSRDVMTDANCG